MNHTYTDRTGQQRTHKYELTTEAEKLAIDLIAIINDQNCIATNNLSAKLGYEPDSELIDELEKEMFMLATNKMKTQYIVCPYITHKDNGQHSKLFKTWWRRIKANGNTYNAPSHRSKYRSMMYEIQDLTD